MSLELIERSLKKKQEIEFSKPTLSREDLENVLECLVEDHLSTGEIVEKFEKVFQSTFKFKNTISINSLTSAYHLALLTLKIGQGDKVILSTFAPRNALDAIFMVGAEPVLVDLDKESFHIAKRGVVEKISPEVKAVILDHNFGALINIRSYQLENVQIIEDFSEAIGADSEDIPVGKQSDISICALNVNQIITTGNGAMICTADNDIAKEIRFYKLGNKNKLSVGVPKYDYNLIDYQAALGIEQLSKLGVLIERKRKIAQIYLQSLIAKNVSTWFKRPAEDQFNRFPLIVSSPFDEVERYFQSLHIGTMRTAEEPLHRILELSNSDFPNGEKLYQRGHCIPIYPNLTRDNILRISNSIKRIC